MGVLVPVIKVVPIIIRILLTRLPLAAVVQLIIEALFIKVVVVNHLGGEERVQQEGKKRNRTVRGQT